MAWKVRLASASDVGVLVSCQEFPDEEKQQKESKKQQHGDSRIAVDGNSLGEWNDHPKPSWTPSWSWMCCYVWLLEDVRVWDSGVSSLLAELRVKSWLLT